LKTSEIKQKSSRHFFYSTVGQGERFENSSYTIIENNLQLSGIKIFFILQLTGKKPKSKFTYYLFYLLI